jgi:hypothetical protein
LYKVTLLIVEDGECVEEAPTFGTNFTNEAYMSRIRPAITA